MELSSREIAYLAFVRPGIATNIGEYCRSLFQEWKEGKNSELGLPIPWGAPSDSGS